MGNWALRFLSLVVMLESMDFNLRETILIT